MKTFKEYLTEGQKVWSFRIKVAGELPENFQTSVKERMQKFGVSRFEKTKQTPIQKSAIDFPQLENVEVAVFEVETAYPTTPPEISNIIKACNLIKEEYVVVRYTTEETDYADMEESKESLLLDPNYTEMSKIKHKDYFGDEFNKNFLKDLEKTAKARKKELGHDKGKPDVLGAAPKVKQDKAGAKSAMGS
jgi:hypothetical protein